MLNLLNEISSMAIGIISLFVLIAIITGFILLACKLKTNLLMRTSVAFILALIVAVFLCKPILALFDKMFSFSMIFFNAYMIKFSAITSLNVRVTDANYDTVVANFRDSNIGMSETYKSFLVNVFESTTPPTESPTTLSAIAASSASYMTSLFLIAFILFIISFVLFFFLTKLVGKKIKFKKTRNLRPLSIILGVIKGVVAVIAIMITMSTLPFVNVTNDYFGNGFESTKILSPLYKTVVNVEQNIYDSTINFDKINSRIYQSKDTLVYGTYQNNTSGVEYRINIRINNDNIKVDILSFADKHNTVVTCDYVYINSSVYAYNGNKFEYAFKFNQKTKNFEYSSVSYKKIFTYILKPLIISGD